MDSRLERIRNQICDGLAGIKDDAKPGTSTEFYRTNVKTVRRGLIGGKVGEGETPLLCVDFSGWYVDPRNETKTTNLQVFDLLALFHIHGYYGGAITAAGNAVFPAMEAVGHPFIHDVCRWLFNNAISNRTNADEDLRWMIDFINFKFNVDAYDRDENFGKFSINFTVRVDSTTPDLI